MHLGQLKNDELNSITEACFSNVNEKKREKAARRFAIALARTGYTSRVRRLQLRMSDVLVVAESKRKNSNSSGTTTVKGHPFLDYTRKSLHLQDVHLEIDSAAAGRNDELTLTKLPNAIASSQSITKLNLAGLRPETMNFVNAILRKLASATAAAAADVNGSDPPLETLGFVFECDPDQYNNEFPDALPMLFQSRTRPLQELNLYFFFMDKDLCEMLFKTLPSCAQTFVKTIVMRAVMFNEEGAQLFGKYLMQDEKECKALYGGSDETTVAATTAAPVDIHIDRPQQDEDEFMYPPSFSSPFLTPPGGRWRVRKLKMNIVSLHLPIVAYCLPKAVYMQDLDLTCDQVDIDEDNEERLRQPSSLNIPPLLLRQCRGSGACARQQLLKAIRQNGSLHRFALRMDELFFLPHQYYQIETYLTRNRELPRMLSNPLVPEKDESTIAKATDSSESAERQTDVKLYPALLTAATVTPSMSPTNVLRGLAAKGGQWYGSLSLSHQTVDGKRAAGSTLHG